MAKKTKAKAARQGGQAQPPKRRSPDAAILDDIRAAFQRVRDTGGREEHPAVCREAIDLAAANWQLLRKYADMYVPSQAMEDFMHGGEWKPLALKQYALLSSAQRGGPYLGGTVATWCASDVKMDPGGEQIMADLERWAGQASTTPNGAGVVEPVQAKVITWAFKVGKCTLRRAVKEGKLRDCRPAEKQGTNFPLLLDPAEVARYWPRRVRV